MQGLLVERAVLGARVAQLENEWRQLLRIQLDLLNGRINVFEPQLFSFELPEACVKVNFTLINQNEHANQRRRLSADISSLKQRINELEIERDILLLRLTEGNGGVGIRSF